jgi:hypothetical protein
MSRFELIRLDHDQPQRPSTSARLIATTTSAALASPATVFIGSLNILRSTVGNTSLSAPAPVAPMTNGFRTGAAAVNNASTAHGIASIACVRVRSSRTMGASS